MEMKLVYEVLGEQDQHILASHISHLHDICKEILGFVEHDCLKDLIFTSYVPGRIRGVAQILNEIYERFECSVKENKIDDLNVRMFMQNFFEFVSLVSGLEKGMKKFCYDYRDDSAFLKYTYDLVDFFKNKEFYVEDSEF